MGVYDSARNIITNSPFGAIGGGIYNTIAKATGQPGLNMTSPEASTTRQLNYGGQRYDIAGTQADVDRAKGYLDYQNRMMNLPGLQSTEEQATTTQQVKDPFARWGGQANYNALLSQYNNQRNSIFDSINRLRDAKAQDYGRGVEDYEFSARQQQQGINNKAAQNELAKMQGRSSILDKVSQGIKSGGVMLGNKNAGSSSAGKAIADAYSKVGNRDMAKVEQGYQLNNENIGIEQQNFNELNQKQTRRFEEDKLGVVNSIVGEAENALRALDNEIAGASLPNRIAIEQEKNRIRAEAQAKLGEYDRFINSARGQQGWNQDQRISEANRLQQMGTAAAPLFGESLDVMTPQQTAPAGGNLPIYTIPRRRV